MTESVRNGLLVGSGLALAQSLLSTLALKWALKKPVFYWIWMGGILGRIAVLIATALVVMQHTQLNLVATLLSLVVATAAFLVVEAQIFLTD